jgi:DNA-binding LacI/PurR family transcriptional regulator
MVSFLLRAAHALNVAIPEQLSVVGYDSLALCDYLEPRLTSLREPLEEMGRRAYLMLRERLLGMQRSAMRVRVLGVTLDVRESTGPAPVTPDAPERMALAGVGD